ncbi:MAG TPA: electron transfer flavoprotein beta subunit/FixA family protein, partial [Planctomycetes bacterium]|nr:electron transfer flavoprotein beta subunit/FixA family protein [Planctomycetota bacterium]
MKIAVCMKRVPDTATRLSFASDGTSIDTSEVQWVISPYDEYA